MFELKCSQFILKSNEVPNKFTLTPIEFKDYIDFEVKRIYFITNIIAPTGSHCHKEEKEFFVLIKGSCTAVIDKGAGLEEINLVGPTAALYVGNFVWHHFKNFSPDSILLALSSTNYQADRSDYIEDYEQYHKTIKEMQPI